MSVALRNALTVSKMTSSEKRDHYRLMQTVKGIEVTKREIKHKGSQFSVDKVLSEAMPVFEKTKGSSSFLNETVTASIDDQLTEINNLKNCLSLKIQSAFKVIESYDFSEKTYLSEYLFELANNPHQTIKKYGNSKDLEIWQNILSKITIVIDKFLKYEDSLFTIRERIKMNPKFNQFPLYIRARLLNFDLDNILNTDMLYQEEISFEFQRKIINDFDSHVKIAKSKIFESVKDLNELLKRTQISGTPGRIIYKPEEESSVFVRKTQKFIDNLFSFLEKKLI